jgi:hypothetical protein
LLSLTPCHKKSELFPIFTVENLEGLSVLRGKKQTIGKIGDDLQAEGREYAEGIPRIPEGKLRI